MNEIFGEENFLATIIWQKVFSPKNSARHFSEDHDFIVAFARNAEIWVPSLLPRGEAANARYSNPDNDPRGPWQSGDLAARNFYSKGQYEVVGPTGKKFSAPVGRYWVVSQDVFQEMDRNNEIWWGADGSGVPRQKRFLSQVKQGIVPQTLWPYSDVGHTQEAKKELLELVSFSDPENVLNSVKPSRLIQRIVQIATVPHDNDLVLDFFGGSGTSGHAVMKQNAVDGGNRHFISVQFPEQLPKPDSDMRTIFDISTARLTSAGRKLANDRAGNLDLDGSGPLDLGFRAYRLTESNFVPWNGGGWFRRYAC
jgi:adenine-specific DNA-methyltransferase